MTYIWNGNGLVTGTTKVLQQVLDEDGALRDVALCSVSVRRLGRAGE